MKKKLKKEIFQEIEKEDRYQNKLNKIKYNMTFAEPKKKKKGPTFWVPILCSAGAALFVAIFVPTYIAVHEANDYVAREDTGGVPLSADTSTIPGNSSYTNDSTLIDEDIMANFTGINVTAVDASNGKSAKLSGVTFDFYPCVLESSLYALAFITTPDTDQFNKTFLSISISSVAVDDIQYDEENSAIGYVVVNVSQGETCSFLVDYDGDSYGFNMAFNLTKN